MIKLLDANFNKLKKDKVFIGLTIFTIGFSLFIIFNQYNDMIKYNEIIDTWELLPIYVLIIGVVTSVFASIFIGTDYSDGTIRNKIIIGHKRRDIYISNFFIVSLVTIFLQILFMILVALIGIPLFGGLSLSLGTLLLVLLDIIMIDIFYSAIFTFIAMICSNKTVISIISILLAFGLLLASSVITEVLQAPEYINSAKITNSDTGDFKMVEEKNPRYPSETQKKVYTTALNFLPSGQAFKITGIVDGNIEFLSIYSLCMTIIISTIGLVIFNKKELK